MVEIWLDFFRLLEEDPDVVVLPCSARLVISIVFKVWQRLDFYVEAEQRLVFFMLAGKSLVFCQLGGLC